MTAPSLYAKHHQIADHVAHDYYLPGADADDVRQECRVALWEACRCYKPERGPFPPFARLVIRARMQDAITHANRRSRRLLTDAEREHDDIQTLDPVEQREALHELTLRCAQLNERDRLTLERIVNEIPIAGKTDDTQRYRLRKKLAA